LLFVHRYSIRIILVTVGEVSFVKSYQEEQADLKILNFSIKKFKEKREEMMELLF
jgi:hypothetical protein